MKDKKEEQIAIKRQHKAALQLATRRKRAEPNFEDEAPTRVERQSILIVCEGVNTEPSYFRQFRLTSCRIVEVGAGCNTIQVVKRAIEEQENGQYDQVWVVFDKDDFPANNFNAAIEMAKQNNFGVAYSNQSFEYWLVLHFEDHQGGGMHRDDYHGKLNEQLARLGLFYDGKGSKIISKEIFDSLLAFDPKLNRPRMEVAIDRARRIFNSYDHRSPAE